MKSVQPAVRPVASVAFFSPISILNILLLGLVIAGLAYYVSGANSLASAEYRISSLRNKISHLNEEQSRLAAEKSAAEDPAAAAEFAQAQHMVSAQEIVYVFENGNVALHR